MNVNYIRPCIPPIHTPLPKKMASIDPFTSSNGDTHDDAAEITIQENPLSSPNAHLVLDQTTNEHVQMAPCITEINPGAPTVYTVILQAVQEHVRYDNTNPITFVFNPNKFIHRADTPPATKKYTIRQIDIVEANATQKYAYSVDAYAIDASVKGTRVPLFPLPYHHTAHKEAPSAAIIAFGDPRPPTDCHLLPEDTATFTSTAIQEVNDGGTIVGTNLKNFINLTSQDLERGVHKYWDHRPIAGLPAVVREKGSPDMTTYAQLLYFTQTQQNIYSPNPVTWLITKNTKYIARSMQTQGAAPLILTNPTGADQHSIIVHRSVFEFFHALVVEKMASANRTLNGDILIECIPDVDGGRITNPAISNFASEESLSDHIEKDFLHPTKRTPSYRPNLKIQIKVCEYNITYADPTSSA